MKLIPQFSSIQIGLEVFIAALATEITFILAVALSDR
jgi:hypothetical protein